MCESGCVLFVTTGPRHKPFESAWTARGLQVPSIWSEHSTHCGAQSAVGRAKHASIRIGERYTTRPTLAPLLDYEHTKPLDEH